MAVVINEFEVVPETGPPAAPAAPPSAQAARLDPAELARLLADSHARAVRARAY